MNTTTHLRGSGFLACFPILAAAICSAQTTNVVSHGGFAEASAVNPYRDLYVALRCRNDTKRQSSARCSERCVCLCKHQPVRAIAC
jgi:hypothetical protein